MNPLPFLSVSAIKRIGYLSFILLLFTGFLAPSNECNSVDVQQQCNNSIPEQFTFAKALLIEPTDFDSKTHIVKYSFLFTKGNAYLITVCDNHQGADKLLVELKDNLGNVVAKSYQKENRHYFSKMMFKCSATEMYTLNYSFLQGTTGCGVSSIAFLKG